MTQVLVNFQASDKFRTEMTEAAEKAGLPISEFIRQAVREKMESVGCPVSSLAITFAPSRAGKGGPRKVSSDPDKVAGALHNAKDSAERNAHNADKKPKGAG